MDFSLSEEQQLIIASTREFVRAGAGTARARGGGERRAARGAARGTEGQGHRRRPVRGQHAHRGRRRGLDAVSWMLYEKELGLHRLRAAVRLRRAAVEHPAGLQGRAARALPAAGRARRARRLPGHDRAGGGLGCARHEVQRGASRAATSSSTAPSTSSATPTMPTSSSCSPPAARRTPPRGKRKLITAFLVDKGIAGLRGAPGLQQRLAPRLHQQHPRVHRLPGAEVGGARRGAPRLRGGQYLAGRHAPAGGGHLPGARRAGAGELPSSGRSIASSSGSRSASSRAWRSSSPTWRSSCGRRNC